MRKGEEKKGVYIHAYNSMGSGFSLRDHRESQGEGTVVCKVQISGGLPGALRFPCHTYIPVAPEDLVEYDALARVLAASDSGVWARTAWPSVGESR